MLRKHQPCLAVQIGAKRNWTTNATDPMRATRGICHSEDDADKEAKNQRCLGSVQVRVQVQVRVRVSDAVCYALSRSPGLVVYYSQRSWQCTDTTNLGRKLSATPLSRDPTGIDLTCIGGLRGSRSQGRFGGNMLWEQLSGGNLLVGHIHVDPRKRPAPSANVHTDARAIDVTRTDLHGTSSWYHRSTAYMLGNEV